MIENMDKIIKELEIRIQIKNLNDEYFYGKYE